MTAVTDTRRILGAEVGEGLRAVLREPTALFFSVLMPVGFYALFTSIFGGGADPGTGLSYAATSLATYGTFGVVSVWDHTSDTHGEFELDISSWYGDERLWDRRESLAFVDTYPVYVAPNSVFHTGANVREIDPAGALLRQSPVRGLGQVPPPEQAEIQGIVYGNDGSIYVAYLAYTANDLSAGTLPFLSRIDPPQ